MESETAPACHPHFFGDYCPFVDGHGFSVSSSDWVRSAVIRNEGSLYKMKNVPRPRIFMMMTQLHLLEAICWLSVGRLLREFKA